MNDIVAKYEIRGVDGNFIQVGGKRKIKYHLSVKDSSQEGEDE